MNRLPLACAAAIFAVSAAGAARAAEVIVDSTFSFVANAIRNLSVTVESTGDSVVLDVDFELGIFGTLQPASAFPVYDGVLPGTTTREVWAEAIVLSIADALNAYNADPGTADISRVGEGIIGADAGFQAFLPVSDSPSPELVNDRKLLDFGRGVWVDDGVTTTAKILANWIYIVLSVAPEPTVVINSGTLNYFDGEFGFPDVNLYVQNAGCDATVERPCASPGNSTQVILIDGAFVDLDVVTFEFSRAIVAERAVVGRNLIANDQSGISIVGGSIGGALVANDSSQIGISGRDFAVDGVPVDTSTPLPPSGRLTGTLASGEPLDNVFCQAGCTDFGPPATGSFKVSVAPEPQAGALGAGAACALAGLRARSRRRRS